MPIVRRGKRFGMGQGIILGEPVYNSAGQYEGGNAFVSLYCDSIFGQYFSPQTCGIPTTSQQSSLQAAELATTSAPTSVQAAAVTAGDQAVAEACSGDPADCIAQNAASLFPMLSSALGANNAGSIMGVQPDGSVDFTQGYLPWIIGLGFGILAVGMMAGGKH